MTEIPPFSLEVPQGFHELPVAVTGDAREQSLADLVQGIYPQADPEVRQAITPMVASATAVMADAQLTYAAIGLFSDGPDKVAQCALTLAVAPSDHPSAEVAAHGLREILARTDSVEAGYVDLPCGPAVTAISISEVTYDGEYTTTGEPATLRMGRLQAYVPFPTGPYLAVLTLDTPAMDYWENFSVMMGTVLMGMEFHEPLNDEAEPSR
ncbi:hypothetical protein [Streptomyces sp. NPDC020917]|uniref:hypothetical protein n=1 Tax=Streptomyces sp. NPDC020917 TaxID=3365102 RepID=UPI00379AD262